MITILMTAIALLFGSPAETNPEAITNHGGEIDLAASTVTWLGKKVVGEHSGTINLKAASLDFKNHKLVGGQFTIDMTTIACTDLDAEWGGKLVGHLSNEDFFEVANFPTSELKITQVIESATANNYAITADLTIKGINHPIQFDATVGEKKATADLNIDRIKYGIKYGSGSFFDNLGDKAIDNKFKLSVNLVIK